MLTLCWKANNCSHGKIWQFTSFYGEFQWESKLNEENMDRKLTTPFKWSQPLRIVIRGYVWHLWPSTTKCCSLRRVSKVRKVFHCNKHYFLHIWCKKWLLCDIPIKSYKMLNIPMYIIQNNFTEIWAVKDCNLCVLNSMGQWRSKCFITPLSFYIFIEKMFLIIVFGMMNI